MPRMPAKIRRRYREGLEILDSEVEEAFLRGEGLLGTPPDIPSTRGDGQWHHRYPEPYQRDETLHLRDLGVVDDAELKRHRAWRRDGMPFTYVFEQGSYE